MDFIKATDALCQQVTLDDLAKEMGLSGQTLRKARVTTGSTATRSPPPGWERAALKLIDRRIAELARLKIRLSQG